MNAQELLNYLDQAKIEYKHVEHPPVDNMEELVAVTQLYPGYQAKNLFVRDDKKQRYLLISVKENQSVDLKWLRHHLETRRLSFASAEDLRFILALEPGSVTPFGLLNDQDHRVEFVLDQAYLSGDAVMGIHPNTNDATVWIATDVLLELLKQSGATIHIVDFNQMLDES